jgi:hypothetical protein
MLLLLRSLLSLFDVLVLRLLLSVLVFEWVLLLLLSDVLFDEFMLLLVFECVLLLLLSLVLFDEFMLLLLRSLLSVLVVLVFVVAVRVVVTVLPPRATTESSACALSEKASEIAVTSKVLFIRFPLWVLVSGRPAVAPTLLSIAQPMPAT